MQPDAPESNSYLGEVLQQQQRVDLELKRKLRAPAAPSARAAAAVEEAAPSPVEGRAAPDYRITGWWRWRTVVVPPNVYVVHTRRGEDQPLHMGMGESFRYNPFTDSFLVIPAVIQTIVISARCICAERQGILVQAYVQWIIDDIGKAYKKLDFSDADDRMRIVNVQLREQAEAAIKDKVATLRIDEVLADKQPIIEELTHRLRTVAEGTQEGGGLGLKIVTVQIKEAVVSSTRLWENLQKPFRAEREKLARMAELETDQQVAARQLEIRQARETSEITAQSELQKHRAVVERVAFDRAQQELLRRAAAEQETERRTAADKNATEIARREGELELVLKGLEVMRKKVEAELETVAQQRKLDLAAAGRSRAQAEEGLALEELRSKAQALVAEREIAQFRARREVENEMSDGLVRSQLVAALPEIASKLPAPKELKSVTISGDGAAGGAAALAGLLSSLLAVVEGRAPGK